MRTDLSVAILDIIGKRQLKGKATSVEILVNELMKKGFKFRMKGTKKDFIMNVEKRLKEDLMYDLNYIG